MLFNRKAPRQRWSSAGRSPPSFLTSPSGRSSWRQRPRRSLRRRWCSRGNSLLQSTSSPLPWGRRRPTLAVTNPSRLAAACIYVCELHILCVKHFCIRWLDTFPHILKQHVIIWQHYMSSPVLLVLIFLPYLALIFRHLISTQRNKTSHIDLHISNCYFLFSSTLFLLL